MDEKVDKLDQMLEKFENVAVTFIEDFEKKPLRSSIKVLLYYWIIKKIWDNIRRI